ncbi:MAG TPA: efflux RND transporter periplasmic adaptor subunit [Burkholderiaceae bacterium]|nr:efflux RND transporter periplasmic adaptor subunit [Burkholderiaceae bacterium]
MPALLRLTRLRAHAVARATFATLLGAAVLASAAGCGQGRADAPPAGAGGPPPAAVDTLTIAPRDVPVAFEYVGQVAGSREIEVRARVTGIVEKRLYAEGTAVNAGQPLFLLDPQPFRARLALAEAQLAQAQARVRQAARDEARIRPLAEAQAASRKEADDAASALDLARASLKAAEAQVLQARLDLGYTEVRAPLPGIVGRALKAEGSLADANGDNLLATLAQVDPAYVVYGVGEAERIRIADEIASGRLLVPSEGFSVRVKLSDGKVLDRTGRVAFRDYKSDPTTGSFAARAVLPNPDGRLAPGQFVRVMLHGAVRPQAIVVPQRAVLDSPNGKFVYVIGQGANGGPIAEPRPVQVGEWVRLDGLLANGWVIRDGLQPGDRVIVDGTARIFFPGAPVQPTDAHAAAEAAGATSPVAASSAAPTVTR